MYWGCALARKHDEWIAREGWPFLIPLLLMTGISFGVDWPVALGVALAILTLFVAYFFRNPSRTIPVEPGSIVSPADGKVVRIARAEDGRWMISIFLNVFNVHVNRSPVSGSIRRIDYKKGRFMAANHQAASLENERNILCIESGPSRFDVVQVAGLIARRIVCWKRPADRVTVGERFGLIRFGSRVDIFLPQACELLINEGDKVAGGSSMIARIDPNLLAVTS